MKSLWFSLSGIELVNKSTTEKNLYSANFPDIYPIHPFSNFFIFFQFLPLQGDETYFSQEAMTVSRQ